MKKNYLNFIKALLIVSIPIILQQLFLNIASLMVGRLDEASVSGVYVANQIVFVINLLIFGSTEGASVFFCQFQGSNDEDHLVKSFVFKVYASFIFSFLATLIVLLFSKQLSSVFLQDQDAIKISSDYLKILAYSFIPYALSVSISTCMRESHHAILPMLITLFGAFCNFCVNYLLIFGNLGFPKMGASGAAIGTIINRVIEVILLVIAALITKYNFTHHLFQNLKIEKNLMISMIKKSIPLVINETLWALGQIMLVFFFSKVDSIATVVLPISSTIYNLIFVVSLGLGNGITILIGATVGANDFDKAQEQAKVSLLFSLCISIILGTVLFLIAPWISSLYTGVSADAQAIATDLIKFNGFYLILCTLNSAIFFLLRAGGRTEIVFFFDSFYGWIIQIPLCFLLLKVANLELREFVMLVYSIDIIKTIVGLVLICSKKWIKNLTNQFTKKEVPYE